MQRVTYDFHNVNMDECLNAIPNKHALEYDGMITDEYRGRGQANGKQNTCMKPTTTTTTATLKLIWDVDYF